MSHWLRASVIHKVMVSEPRQQKSTGLCIVYLPTAYDRICYSSIHTLSANDAISLWQLAVLHAAMIDNVGGSCILACRTMIDSVGGSCILACRTHTIVVVVDPTPPTCCQQSPAPESCGSQQSLPPGGKERLHFVGIRPEVQARKGGW